MALSELTNYIEDDWDDNNLTNRTGNEKGYFLHPSDNLISDVEAGDALKGVYRPEWNVTNGTVKADNQQLEMASGNSRIATPSNFTTGSWNIDYQNNSTASEGFFEFEIIRNSGNTKSLEWLNWPFNGYHILRYDDNGSRTTLVQSGSAITDTNIHSVTHTRDSYGSVEVIVDSASVGTSTESRLPTPDSISMFNSNSTPQVNIDNLVIQ